MPRYVTGTAQITSQIQNQGDTLDITLNIKKGQTPPTAGQEIIFKDGSRTLFGGFITKMTPTEIGAGELISFAIEATDYTYILINKTVQGAYTDWTLYEIVTDIITNDIDSRYGISYAGVSAISPPILSTVTFNHTTIRQAFETLAKLTGCIWWMGYDKVVYFISPTQALPAPEQITDTSKNWIEGMQISVDVTQVKNDIVVLGGTSESAAYTQEIKCDGVAREWVLLYPVQTMQEVDLDSGSGYVTKTFGVDPVDDETLYYSVYSPTRGSIRVGSGTTTPASGYKIKVKYTYPVPIITEVKDATSIIAMQALEGGDGIHKDTISDPTITSQDQAVIQALTELLAFSFPILSGEFQTRTGLLTKPGFFAAGQAITVYLPSWGISGSTVYIVQKIVTTLAESGSSIEYFYDITFGGRLIGVLDFLQALAEPQTPMDTSGLLQKVLSLADVVTTAETITQNGNEKTDNETVTTAETIAMALFTPPYKWQTDPGATTAYWNLAQWG